MPYEQDESTGESPYERALREGGQTAADELLRASEEYYSRTSPASQEEHGQTNWFDPASYAWLTNTPGPTEAAPEAAPRATSAPTSWFELNLPSNFGAAPAPFGEQYSTLARPAYLQGEYRAPVWSEQFAAPTMDEVTSDPGYQTRLGAGQLARERSAAAQGSLLSGGQQKKLERYGQEFGANEYANVYGRRYDDYRQRYGAFVDQANMGLQARGVNESAYQSDVGNNLSQYLSRYNAYQDQVSAQRQSEQDYWSRNQDLVRNALDAERLRAPAG